MTEKQFLTLLSTASATSTTLEFQLKQVELFSHKVSQQGSQITVSLDEIYANLQALAANPPPLSKSDNDILSRLKTNLGKITRDISTQLEKPFLQYKAHIDKIQLKLAEKLLPTLLQSNEYNLDSMRKHIERSQALIKKINVLLDGVLQIIAQCQTKCSQVEGKLTRLNLPNEIVAVTKSMDKTANDLQTLGKHIAEAPEALEAYQAQFMPLFVAMQRLKVQEDSITESKQASPRPT